MILTTLMRVGTSMSFAKLATETYSTKRSPVYSSGKTGLPSTHLTNVKCVAIMPLISGDSDKIQRPANISVSGRVKKHWITSTQVHQHTDGGSTVTKLPDIIEDDILVVGSKNYNVKEVHSWPATSSTPAFLYLVIEESR